MPPPVEFGALSPVARLNQLFTPPPDRWQHVEMTSPFFRPEIWPDTQENPFLSRRTYVPHSAIQAQQDDGDSLARSFSPDLAVVGFLPHVDGAEYLQDDTYEGPAGDAEVYGYTDLPVEGEEDEEDFREFWRSRPAML
jgi:hypothetical protein